MAIGSQLAEDESMDIGLVVPTRGPLATPDAIRTLVRRAEELGYAHLVVSDHLVVPRSIDSRYPYSESGDWAGGASGQCLEMFTLLAFLAAVSERMRLVTGVAVIPYRGAVHTAKIATTIDILSNGRMVLGAGAGWMKEEFEALNVPPFGERGRLTDEYLEAFKTLCSEDDPRQDGTFVQYGDISFLPKPVQRPHPPIWVGGESGPAVRRAVRYGDSWFPIGNNPRHRLDTVARFEDGVRRLHAAAEKHGRDPSTIGLAFYCAWFDHDKHLEAEGSERHILSGSADAVIEDIRALAATGVTDLVFNLQRDSLDSSIATMERFMSEIGERV
jgi:probable F420-dependent oxidoreductase